MGHHQHFFRKGVLLFLGLGGLILLSAGGKAWAQTAIFSEPLSQRLTSYDMKVRLDPDQKRVTGRMILVWRNPSNDAVGELQFHLYLNAFKNTKSTFMRESNGAHRGFDHDGLKADAWGYIDVTSLGVVNGGDLTDRMRFIAPDDGNADDRTVMAVALDTPVPPRGEISLECTFVAKLPQIFARTGYADEYFLVAQWFPKIGVYEPAGQRFAKVGQWNCHQFHQNSEFYANHGVYQVEITLPKRFIVGSCGITQSERENPDGTKTLQIRAEDIVDFAWTASPRFVVVEDRWKHVEIKAYLQPEHLSQAARHIDSAKAAFSYFEEHLGFYPYPHFAIVDPPMRGMGSAGMEYTTLITAGCFWGIPSGLRFTEMVTIHELGHAYFMGILASNEFEEPWIDEGLNTYFETRIMDHTYGKKSSFVDWMGLKIGDSESARSTYVGMRNPKIAENARAAWEFPHGGYGALSYQKTATWMHTLAGLVGQETMDEIMKTFYERWKFRHPCGTDFIAIVNEVVARRQGDRFGEGMDWYFDQVLYGSGVCDYKLADIRNEKKEPHRGLETVNGEKVLLKEAADPGAGYRSRVVLHRLGEVCLPVEVAVGFENGEVAMESWNGTARSIEFRFERPSKVAWAQVDPQGKIPLDVNLMNNSLRSEPRKSSARGLGMKVLFWLQNVMQVFSIFS
jgi:hypothetical protein